MINLNMINFVTKIFFYKLEIQIGQFKKYLLVMNMLKAVIFEAI